MTEDPLRILLVEDSPAEALEMSAGRGYDLILMDSPLFPDRIAPHGETACLVLEA